MGIDASIYNRLQAPQIDSPLDVYAKVSQYKAQQNQNRLADMLFGEKERELAGDNALARLLSSGKKGDDVATGLAQAGYGAKSLAYTKQQQELLKQQADIGQVQAATTKSGVESAKVLNGMFGSAAYAILQNPSYENAMAIHADLRSKLPPALAAKMDGSEIPKDPAALKQWANAHYLKSIETDKIMADNTSRRNNDQTNATSRANNAATNATTQRGQDMTDARAKETLAQGGKPPAGYRFTADGSLEAIKGGPAEKDGGGTEGERTAAGYGLRMAEAEKIFGSVVSKNAGAQKPGAVEKLAGPGVLANLASSQDRQMYRQAQEDWVRAKLRKESGAVIGEEEMTREISTYFPQPAEGAKVIAQKAEARKTAMDAMRIAAGKAAKNIPSDNAPSVGMVQDGYRFKGGNPGDPKSWEKI